MFSAEIGEYEPELSAFIVARYLKRFCRLGCANRLQRKNRKCRQNLFFSLDDNSDQTSYVLTDPECGQVEKMVTKICDFPRCFSTFRL